MEGSSQSVVLTFVFFLRAGTAGMQRDHDDVGLTDPLRCLIEDAGEVKVALRCYALAGHLGQRLD